MSIERALLEAAKQLAEAQQKKALRLQIQYDDLQSQTAEVKLKRDAARNAEQLFLNYRPAFGTDYICPRCWIENENRSPLRARPGTAKEDFFECTNCHLELSL